MLDETRVIYEMENENVFSWMALFFLIFLGVILIVFVKKFIDYTHSRFIPLFIGVFFAIVIITLIGTEVDSMKMYYDYKNGDYFFIEGMVDHYEVNLEKKYDRFWVNGKEFVINGSNTFGYDRTQSMGSELDSGVYIKIRYIPYANTNVITRLEIVDN